ncbi:MAG: thioredoxin [Bacteroidales bacterium]|nr:thioredoxin [Bacteroidales bacterium]
MKKLLFALLTVILFTQCSKAGNKESAKGETNAVAKSNVQHITRAEFLKNVFDYQKDSKEVNYLGSRPAVVDFYATWCGPCKQISPLLEQLAGEYNGKFVLYKIDTDKEQQLASELGIQALPTLVFFPMKGKPIMIQGFRPKEELKKIIDTQLLK